MSNEAVVSGTHQEGGKTTSFSFHKDEEVTIVHEDETGVVVSVPRFTLNVLLSWSELEESHLHIKERA